MNKQAIIQRAKTDPSYRKRVIAQLRARRLPESRKASSSDPFALLKKIVDWNALREINRLDSTFYDEVFSETIAAFEKAIWKSNLAPASNMLNLAVSLADKGDLEGCQNQLFKVRNLLK